MRKKDEHIYILFLLAFLVLELDYFRERPQPFFTLAKELYPGKFKPTACHCFVRLLHEKGLLLRNYTQNIDTLERIAGVPAEKLVEAHGSFASAHCIACKLPYTQEFVKGEMIVEFFFFLSFFCKTQYCSTNSRGSVLGYYSTLYRVQGACETSTRFIA